MKWNEKYVPAFLMTNVLSFSEGNLLKAPLRTFLIKFQFIFIFSNFLYSFHSPSVLAGKFIKSNVRKFGVRDGRRYNEGRPVLTLLSRGVSYRHMKTAVKGGEITVRTVTIKLPNLQWRHVTQQIQIPLLPICHVAIANALIPYGLTGSPWYPHPFFSP